MQFYIHGLIFFHVQKLMKQVLNHSQHFFLRKQHNPRYLFLKDIMNIKINKHRKGLSFYSEPISRKMQLQFDTPRFKHLILLFLLVSLLYLFYLHHHRPFSSTAITSIDSKSTTTINTKTTLQNILISIASSSSSFPRRLPYLRIWYNPNSTRVLVFLEQLPNGENGGHSSSDVLLPPIVVSEKTSNFTYTFRSGHRSAIRIARMVKEVYDRGESNVRWFVFGDDDTIFFPENLATVLSSYDHNQWYYLGCRSESIEQNVKMSFDMAYGGGGFAISASLARFLARVLDSCLMRYPHLYGSDSRVYSCLAELGVAMTLEPGFHQFDVRGSLLGLLSAHPLSLVLSLHHLDVVEPIFPKMNRIESLQHLFKAVNVDPARILQQTVCYSRSYNLSVSISWGYVVQIYQGYQFITDLISPFRTFTPWRRGAHNNKGQYTINTREYPQNPCKRPTLFFLETVEINDENIWSIYVEKFKHNCYHTNAISRLRDVRVSSTKLEIDTRQLNAPRRQCCDIVHPFDTSMFIHVRPCGEEELISMDP